ncbi:MAG: pyridoxal 5'-phosphate synthase glutaminase subunit PdxT [Odoribacteraceae bacterium]|nr:pyridoxal 5'-phosphate synthase glutaminase subunit PdxT [Odoribacteraceae bacterium]
MKIGILALQGAAREHRQPLQHLGVSTVDVLDPRDLDGIDALVLPGGENTTLGKLLEKYRLLEPIADAGRRGLPLFGTCAGMILMAKHVNKSQQPRLGLMDIRVERNAFGRQQHSFEADLPVPALGARPFHAIFICAPYIEEAGDGVTPLLRHEGKILLARQGYFLAAAFHPELTDDARLHDYFLCEVAR